MENQKHLPGLTESTWTYENRIMPKFDQLSEQQRAEVTTILNNLRACRSAAPLQEVA